MWCHHPSTYRQSPHIKVKPTHARLGNAHDPCLPFLVGHSSFVDQLYLHRVALVHHLQCNLASANRRMKTPIPLPGKYRQYTIEHDLDFSPARVSSHPPGACVCLNLSHSWTEEIITRIFERRRRLAHAVSANKAPKPERSNSPKSNRTLR